MLIRTHDADDDEGRWRAFVADQGFGHFAASGGPAHRTPVVVPTQFVVDNDHVILHLARSNPVFERLEENPHALLSVAGDWAYIPAAWKAIADEDPALGVPTTYYAAVQLAGPVELIDDAPGIADGLRRQLADVEPDSGIADPSTHERKFPAIRGIRLTIEDVRSKYKFGGNVDVEHRTAVAGRLSERNGPGDAAARAQIPGLAG